MGRVPIAQENRTGEGGAGFPAIKLTEKGQKTRFTVIEKPWREYVHYVKAPEFGDDGKPVKENKTRKNGDPYEDNKLEFVSQPICLGDEDILREKGLDEKNCPACDASVKSGADIPGPVQRFAVNVVEYQMSGNSWSIKKPFSATIKVWKLTGRIYDEIEGIQQEIGDLRKHDITLECEDPYWNRNKLAFKMEPGYQSAPAGYIKELLTTEGNRATDAQLKDACGRDVPRGRMQEDVDYALRQWRKLRNEGGQEVPDEFTSGAADLSGGINELLGEETADAGTVLDAMTEEQKEAAGVDAAAPDDPFTEFMPDEPAEPSPEAAPAKATASAKSSVKAAAKKEPATTPTASPSEDAADAGDFDFDNLLEGI